MAANLIRTHTAEESHRLLNLSFAQFQADRDVVQIEARLERKRATLAEKRTESESPYGDIDEYRTLRKAASDNRQQRRQASAGQMRGAMAKLKPGTIIRVSKGNFRGPVAVVATAHRKAGVRLTAITKGEDVLQIDGEDLVDLPRAGGIDQVAAELRAAAQGVPTRCRQAVADRADRLRPLDRVVSGDASERGVEADELDVARDPDLRQRLEAAGAR